MSTTLKVVIGLIVSLFLIVGGTIGYAFSAKFAAEKKEVAIFAQDESMQNTWAMTSNQMKMGGLTLKNFTETDLKKMEIAMKRYADKPNLMMVWAKEQGNTMTPALHAKFMDTIDKIAASKMKTQLSKISVVQEYRAFLNGSFKGQVAQMMGTYPSAKAQKIMDRIISNSKTKETWKTGNDEPDENLFK